MNAITHWWLLRKLKSGDVKARWRAAASLARAGDRCAIEPLLEALRVGDSSWSSVAAEALGLIEDPTVVQPLIDALQHKEYFTRKRAHEALVRVGRLSCEVLSEDLLNYAESVPLDKLLYSEPQRTRAREYAEVLREIGWKPIDSRHRMLFALALGNVLDAAKEKDAALKVFTPLLNHESAEVRESTALRLDSCEVALPSSITSKVKSIVAARKERLAQERIHRIEGLRDDELFCLRCDNVQQKGEWEARMDAQSKAAGYRGGFVNVNMKARCSKCNSDELAGPRWEGYLFEEDRMEYYDKLRKLGVCAKWMR